MAHILKISDATTLAMHSLLLIVHAEWYLSVKEMATQLEVSENHLSKVLQRLVKAGIVKSVRGPKGGFVLQKSKQDVTLLEIYELFEGRIDIGGCLLGHTRCRFERCPFSEELRTLSRHFRDFLQSKTLANAFGTDSSE
jgi:Rrf2 family protein